MTDRAPISPNVLRWGRTSIKMSEEDAAKKAGVAIETLIAWENGMAMPTIRQAEALAKAYRRPFSIFFLPEAPKDFQPLTDYRKSAAKVLGTASLLIIREMQEKQALLRELAEEEGKPPLPFIGKFSLESDPISVSNDIIKTVGIDIGQNGYSDKPLKTWLVAVERAGIFISIASFIHSKLKLDADELKGFAIADSLAPFVFINSDDYDAPTLFTLVHELAHIWIAASGISSEIDYGQNNLENKQPVEIFCNKVAAEVLMPKSLLKKLLKDAFTIPYKYKRVASNLGVSTYALLIRAKDEGYVTHARCTELLRKERRLYDDYLLKQQNKLKKKGGSKELMQRIKLNRNGHLFTHVVIDAMNSGYIQPIQAYNILGITNADLSAFNKLYRI